ncbi:glycosyltransferase family 4 protein [Brucella pseudogrignonensis]|uniref:Glycosyltransferase involved in cell wall biosynthesis n=1 Tax=Brucella pseudogrignonensis TaxID=419475 RepID=A0ABU1MB14_9HYPH|nr:glycosyltransferase family 4 protein [Brucella pseudogrignonensis]MDR6433238.1 glycosyltransferase involved in cell wall biosynthesis [Brucella pseudogrignonensis]
MNPRVLIVTTEAPDVLFSGLGFFNEIFWAELKKRQYPFKVLYLNNQKTRPSKMADYEIMLKPELPFDSSPEALSLNLAWSTSEKIKPILEDYNPDIISVHENSAIMPFYFHLDRVQFTLHSSYIGMQHYLSKTQRGLQHYWEQRIAVRQSGSVVMHSEWAFQSILNHVSADIVKPHIFPIGVNFPDYPQKKTRHPENKIVVSFFGRFTDIVKNFQIFREAINTLPPKLREIIEPRVYGPENIPPYMEKEGFKGLTYVQGDAKRKAFSETDIVVFPSSQESYGIVGLEALLSNCALIATPGLGMDSYIQKEFSCQPNTHDIQNKIIEYITDIKRLRKLQNEGFLRETVNQEKFKIASMVDSYIDVWKSHKDKLNG